jgi:hypothetical protein
MRRFWLYSFDLPSARSLVLASSAIAVLAVGFFYLYPLLSNTTVSRPVSDQPLAVQRPVKIDPGDISQPVITTAVARTGRPASPQIRKPVKAESRPPEQEQIAEQELADAETDYVEFQMIGPDNLPVSVRWPNRPRARYGQTEQEYFIRNVSH